MKKEGSVKLMVSVLIPTYNMGGTIGETIESIFCQTYPNFEVVVQDNNSNDETEKVVLSFNDKKIKYHKNRKNLGYAKNLIAGAKNCRGEIIYFLGADDILAIDALDMVVKIFQKNKGVGAVTRPYFWFQGDVSTPIRVTPFLSRVRDEVVSISDSEKAVVVLHNEVLGQMSGLAFRRKFLLSSYFTNDNDWIAHGYPFVNIFKCYPVVFMKDIPVAIRIGGNTIRQKGSDLYKISPTKRWVEMLTELLSEERFVRLRQLFIKEVISRNYVGLVQIKCYSTFRHLIREIFYLVRYNWDNLFVPQFWFYCLVCILIPQSFLPTMVDFYKNQVNSRLIPTVGFRYKTKVTVF